jgi:outer membrane protein TolC
MKRFSIFLTSIFFVSAVPVLAGPPEAGAPDPQLQLGPLPLSMHDVLRMMLDQNLNVASDRLPPAVAQLLIETYYRPFTPTLHISATGTSGTSPSTSQLSGTTSLFQLTHSYDIGVGQSLHTGTSYGVDIIMNRVSSNNTFLSFNPSWIGQVHYGVTQHVLQNRGSIVNDHTIRIAQNNHKISESQFQQQMMDLVMQAQNMYWDYVFSIEDMKVKQQSLALAQKTLDDNQKKVDAGVMAPVDLIQAELQIANTQDALVVSTYTSLQSEDQIKKVITNQTDPGRVKAKLTPIDAMRRPAEKDVVPVEEAIQIALESRPEMKQAELAVKNAEVDRQYTRNQTLPVLDLNAGYTQSGLGGTEHLKSVLGGTSGVIIPGGLGDALGQTFGFSFNSYSFGFNLQVPLNNKAARSDLARAISAEQLAQAQTDAIAQQIALDVRNAMNQVQMNKARIESAGKARELAQKTLEAEQTKLDLGVSTIYFVLQDQTNLAIAQTNEIQAIVNYDKALVVLDRAMGQTLQHNQIEIEHAEPRFTQSVAN